jgi:transposase
MVGRRQLDLLTIKEIEVLRIQGKSIREIARHTKIAKSTIADVLRSIEVRLSREKAPRSGRPKKTSSRLDQKIVRMAENSDSPNAVDIAKQLAELNLANISPQTVRRRLYEANLHGRALVSKPLLKDHHVKARLEFAKKYRNWTIMDWKRVLWSDESKICLNGSDGRRWTWKRAGERLKPNNVKQTIKFDKSLMVWGCFSANGIGEIRVIDDTLTSAKYVQILSESMLPSAAKLNGSDFIFQHDNDPKHTAKYTKYWLQTHQIEVLTCSAQSSDLNPIEYLWFLFKQLIRREKVKDKNDLPNAIIKCWNSLSVKYCGKLVESMPKRIHVVIKNKGLWTKY